MMQAQTYHFSKVITAEVRLKQGKYERGIHRLPSRSVKAAHASMKVPPSE
jgi:hypothetical protein